MFLKIIKFHKKPPVLEPLFNKVTDLLKRDSTPPVKTCEIFKNNYIVGLYFIKRLQHRCFSVILAKFLRTHFFIEQNFKKIL